MSESRPSIHPDIADPATLKDRLRGIYRIPIRDGLGAVGAGEEPDNPTHFVRRHQTPPIQWAAAERIEALETENAALRKLLDAAQSTGSK